MDVSTIHHTFGGNNGQSSPQTSMHVLSCLLPGFASFPTEFQLIGQPPVHKNGERI